jgi:parvulin-like peptidyl-prolyl isomerase
LYDLKITFNDYLKYRQFYAFRDLFFYQIFVARPTLTSSDAEQLKALQKKFDDLPGQPVERRELQQYLQNIIMVREAKKEFGIEASSTEMEVEISNQIGPVTTFNSFDVSATATAGTIYSALDTLEAATVRAVTPLPDLTRGPTPTPYPTLVPVLSPAATATTRQNNFFDTLQQATGLTRDDYRRLEAEPTIVMRKLDQKLRERAPKVGEPVKQWRFSQIVAQDEASAQSIARELQAVSGSEQQTLFVKLAREKSVDRYSALHNGDTGWQVEVMIDPEILNQIKGLKPGQFGAPVRTNVGWVLVLLTDYEEKRPLDEIQYDYLTGLTYGRSIYFDDWMRAKIQAASVKFFI